MSSVSRSIYQKVCEENKRLKADIWGLINNIQPIRDKWEKTFKEEREFRMMLKEAAKHYMDNHPNDKAVIFVKSLRDKHKLK